MRSKIDWIWNGRYDFDIKIQMVYDSIPEPLLPKLRIWAARVSNFVNFLSFWFWSASSQIIVIKTFINRTRCPCPNTGQVQIWDTYCKGSGSQACKNATTAERQNLNYTKIQTQLSLVFSTTLDHFWIYIYSSSI